jgi:hypothetical protein
VDRAEVASVIADLDDLLSVLYVFADDFLPERDPSRPGRKPRISDAEVICLAVAQVLLDCPKERRFLRFASRRLGHLFGYIRGQSGYNERVRALAPEIVRVLGFLARDLAVVVRRAAAHRLRPVPPDPHSGAGAALRTNEPGTRPDMCRPR